ncbi:Lrp/AsnC family transcriptional regulator [uncultured Caulobacter sp.]|uniref:Lrp/AsnC family transcriptional regulator n=1 Tax=uncultured Caulobacter sp. TaxID=158749 RepID=UPI00263665B2|nr:Lrp/AsnC family transcriptional regulator [uncultured Caulobacter sp.]
MKQELELDAVSRRILALLQDDATISHADLAERVGASSASCWRRVKAMETAGLLEKTVRLVNPVRVGRGVNVLCNVRMGSHSKAARDAFETFVRTQPEIVECFSMSGDWDYLLRIVVADVADYNTYLMGQLLSHPSVANASSHFALNLVKYTTALPV